ncbi:hypothetical protein V6O07_05085, partial [Arthrospira platensis SPKY2]
MSRDKYDNRFKDDMIGYIFGDTNLRGLLYKSNDNTAQDETQYDENVGHVSTNYYIQEVYVKQFVNRLVDKNIINQKTLDKYIRNYATLYVFDDEHNADTLSTIDYLCFCIMHKLIEKVYEIQLDKVLESYKE